jgi:hypothetical protein
MLIISSREKFWDSNNVARQDEIRHVVLADGRSDGTLKPAEFLAKITNKKVLLLVHGYNNETYDVLRSYKIIEDKVNALMPGLYDLVIGYSWPGGDDPFDYFAAKRRASALSPRAGNWLLQMKATVAQLDVMTHSMGAYLVLTALKGDSRIQLDHAFNMASAVDNECLELAQKYHQASKGCKTCYVFHSKYDEVLALAYSLAEWDSALGFSGPEDVAGIVQHCPHVKVANCKNVIDSHGAYKYADAIYAYIANELGGSPVAQFVTL